jgi:chromosome segregation ATPase
MKNLSITINGLEYVEKTSQNSDLQSTIKRLENELAEKDKEINDLQEGFDFDFGLMTLDNEEKDSEINDLKNDVNVALAINRELKKSIEQKNNRIQELTEALQDIVYTAEKAL